MTATPYDFTSPDSRRALAVAIHRAALRSGFGIDPREESSREVTYSRDAGNGRWIVLYSSIEWSTGQVRPRAEDAIRVAAIYHGSDGHDRGIVKDRRVNRVGTIEEIVARLRERVENVAEAVASSALCRECGAPLFKSKKGNLVCAEVCWLKRLPKPVLPTPVSNVVELNRGFSIPPFARIETLSGGQLGRVYVLPNPVEVPSFSVVSAGDDDVEFTAGGERYRVALSGIRTRSAGA